MHIPTGNSSTVDILDFNSALNQATQGKSFDTEKWIYVPSIYTEYRYILGTRGSNPLICIGINPSTAEPDKLDNTLKSVSRIASGNGYDSWIMVNVYAQRATLPSDMDDEVNLKLHQENMEAFRYVLSKVKNDASPAIWAAWGATIGSRSFLYDCLKDMVSIGSEYGAHWYSVGKLSVKGHPHHPLYLRKDEKIVEFDIDNYLTNR